MEKTTHRILSVAEAKSVVNQVVNRAVTLLRLDAAKRLREWAATLTQLDQAIGDGDRGINMDRGFTAVVAMLDAQPTPNGDTRRGKLADCFARRARP